MKRISIFTLTRLAAFLLIAAPAYAACSVSSPVYTATNWSDMKLCMALATHSGDKIHLSGAAFSGTSQAVWNVPPNAVIYGDGDPAVMGGNDATVITDNYSSAAWPASSDSLLVFNINASGTFRMFGITVRGGSGNAIKYPVVKFGGTPLRLRVDHCTFDNQTYSRPDNGWETAMFGNTRGVFDHNVYKLAGTSNGIGMYGNGDGDDMWATATGYGSSDYLYIEDNLWYSNFGGNGRSGAPAVDCTHGAKFVFRFNKMSGDSNGVVALQTHPTQGESARGCRAWEIYANDGTGPNAHPGFNFMFMSSGTGMIWGNRVSSGNMHFMTIHSMRKDNNTYPDKPTPYGWGYCGPSPQSGTVNTSGTTVTLSGGSNFNVSWPVGASNTTMITIATGSDFRNPSSYKIASVDSPTKLTLVTSAGTQTGASYVMGSAWDDNSGPIRCLDQPGNGVGDLLKGSAPTKINTRTGTIAWPRQALEPVYEWMNLPYGCSGCDSADFLSNYEPSVLKANVNYYLHAGAGTIQTNATTPFNGTVGTGFGTLANRPATCTDGTGYAVTDAHASLGTTDWNDGSNPLYTGDLAFQKCIGGTFTTIYTPYTYPHPLVSGGR